MDQLCRTCLRSPNNLLPLNDHNLIQKIEVISSVQISENDYYAPVICEDCVTNVNNFYCFRKVIINSDRELRERYDTLKRTNFISKPRTKAKEVNENCKIFKEESEHFDEKQLILEQDDAIFDETNDSDQQSEVQDKLKQCNLNNIRKAVAQMKISKCVECNLTFTSRLKLYKHKRTVHIAPGICNVCGMVVRVDNLKRHVQMHSDGPVSCKICNKIFKNQESLRGHLLIHRGLSFTCEICRKVSKVKSEHHRHLKTHLDPEAGKIMCTICGKRVRDMKKHMLSHTGERPYTCSYCEKGFTSPYGLKIHTRQHTKEKPFICEYCSMAFPQKVSLMTHLKSKHNVKNT